MLLGLHTYSLYLHGIGQAWADFKLPWPRQLTTFELFEEAVQMGLDGLHLDDGVLESLDTAFLEEVNAAARERGLYLEYNFSMDLGGMGIGIQHDLDEAIRVADRIVIMRGGEIVQNDAPEAILAAPKNKFVHDFVGSDRALKRLSRFSVAEVMHAPVIVRMGDSIEKDLASVRIKKGVRYVWVHDGEDRLRGWLNVKQLEEGRSVEEALTRIEISHMAVSRDSTLREALSRMLGEGVKVVPVVDDRKRIIGEINLHDIERVTEEVEAEWKE